MPTAATASARAKRVSTTAVPIATVIGIVFSIVLVTVQMGLYVSFERMVTVMIDHADAARDGVVGTLDVHFLPAHEDLSLVRLIQSIENIHQGGFACTVFPQQSKNLAFA